MKEKIKQRYRRAGNEWWKRKLALETKKKIGDYEKERKLFIQFQGENVLLMRVHENCDYVFKTCSTLYIGFQGILVLTNVSSSDYILTVLQIPVNT